MNFIEAVKTAFVKYFDFTGRATRAEFWYFIVAALVVGNFITVIENALFYPGSQPEAGSLFSFGVSIFLRPVAAIYTALMVIPWLSVSARRLHDIGRNGFWIYFGFIPPIGWLFMMIWLVREGEAGENEYGPNPMEVDA